ncbi:winged helix-turn-helix domain-containing protein [Herbidospora sp. RD11066]
MTHATVIDLMARQRDIAGAGAEPGEGAVLGVIPLPETGASLVVVGYIVGATGKPSQSTGQREVQIDRESRTVVADGAEIDLTYREFELLDYLAAAPGRVYNRRQLLAAVWDRYDDAGARTVDVHILRLRRKLGRHAARIVTVRNVGYKYAG